MEIEALLPFVKSRADTDRGSDPAFERVTIVVADAPTVTSPKS
jgi:hypothetical protein